MHSIYRLTLKSSVCRAETNESIQPNQSNYNKKNAIKKKKKKQSDLDVSVDNLRQ